MIGVLYFIGTLHLLPIRLCTVSNKHVKLVLEKRKKKKEGSFTVGVHAVSNPTFSYWHLTLWQLLVVP